MDNRFRLYISPMTCIGCLTCQTACQAYHHLPSNVFFRRVDRAVFDEKTGERWFSGSCNHCEHPACIAVCPTGAMHKEEDGTVVHDDGKCIGCGRCLWNCPYGAISMNGISGQAQKCDGCLQRRKDGLDPVCVEACPTKSISIGASYPVRRLEGCSFPEFEMTEPSTMVRCEDEGEEND